VDRDTQETIDVEPYTPERKAEFILSSAIGERDYLAARETVRLLGLDPDRIEHYRPAHG
jgi:hypothetical protein